MSHTRRLVRAVLVITGLAFAVLLISAAPQGPTVPAGGDLQEALDRARPGDTILLQAGATYVGNFVLPVKNGDRYITIRTGSADTRLPAAGQRVLPVHAQTLAKIKSPNNQPAIRTAPGAHHYRLQLLEFPGNEDGRGDIITLGDGSDRQRSLDLVPTDLVVDRCYIHGDGDAGQKRAIALNSGTTSVVDSYISGIRIRGQESQAIAGWNGPGPYRIENNYLEAAGESILFGGADPAIRNLVPSDITIRRNHLSKPTEWRGKGFAAKNLIELKNARKVLIEGNLMEYSWREGQTGYAIVLTPREQGGAAPWATVESVTIRYNIVRHAGGGINILGRDDTGESELARSIRIEHNLFDDIDNERWGGAGNFMQIGLGPADVSVVHNTVLQTGTIITAYGGSKSDPTAAPGFVFRDNIVRHNKFGVFGDGRAFGQDSLDTFFPSAVFSSNAIVGGDRRRYPPDNMFITDDEMADAFVNAAAGDYRVKPGSRLSGAASDRTDLGADLTKIFQLLGLRAPSNRR